MWMVYIDFDLIFFTNNYINLHETIITNNHQLQGEFSGRKKNITSFLPSTHRFQAHLRPTSRLFSSMRRRLSLGASGSSNRSLTNLVHIYSAACSTCFGTSTGCLFLSLKAICQREKSLQKDVSAPCSGYFCCFCFWIVLRHLIEKKCSKFKSVPSRLDIQRPHVFMSTRNVQIENDYMYGSRCMKDCEWINHVCTHIYKEIIPS